MRSAVFAGRGPLRTARLGVAFAVVASLWLSLGGVSALAGEAHPFTNVSFGPSSATTFSNPNGIAIDESTGEVYVAALGSDAVYKFDANGNPVDFFALGSNELTGLHTPSGSFSFPGSAKGTPAAIAVDNSSNPSDPSRGDLYVMDAGHGVIDKFSPSGEYLNQITGFPSATGSSAGELRGLAVDVGGTVQADLKPQLAGAAIKDFDNSHENRLLAERVNPLKNQATNDFGMPFGEKYLAEEQGLAVGPTGDDYLLASACPSCVVKFGQQLGPLGQVDKAGGGDIALAADPASGHVYIDDQSSVSEWDTGAMNGNENTDERPEGTLLARFGEAQLNSASSASEQGGIAVNGTDGRIYVSNPADGKVYVFGSEAPAVSAGMPTNITKEGATLKGAVDPRGVRLTSCEVQYGVADEFGRGAYEHSASCEPEASQLGAGTQSVALSVNVGGLKPGRLYRFHIVAGNASSSSESAGLLATAGSGFGLEAFEVSFLNQDGTPDTQAGSHPYKMVTNMVFKTRFIRLESNADSLYTREPDDTLKNLTVDLPPGLVGDPNATAKKCTLEQLRKEGATGFGSTACPEESRLGDLSLKWNKRLSYGGLQYVEPASNMVPPFGVALQLGVNFTNPLLFINNGVLAGGDYPIQATIVNAPVPVSVLESRLTISGVVGSGVNRKAFLTLPTGCHGPLHSTIHLESYHGETAYASTVTRNDTGTPVGLTGCSKLSFPPEISVAPDTTDASTSSGLTVHVKVPQTAALNPDGLAESTLRDTTVTLPEGVALNPAGADGLEACTSDPGALPVGALGSAGDQIGYKGQEELNKEYEPGVKWSTFTPELASPLAPGTNFCPNGSKVGTVKIKTPLLEHELEGSVYLAAQDSNPFGSLIAMYIVAEDPYSGSLVKLAGEVSLNPDTGQIVTTFKNTPDVPFENLELHFFGGERAPLATPSRCGTYTTKAVFVPWDGNGPAEPTSSFTIDHGPGGGPCPGAPLPFNPTVNAGATNIQAGAFSPLTVTLNRKDGEQNLKSVEAHLPPGLSGVLTGVELCPEPRANEGLCGENSKIGEATIGVGVGNQPFTVTGGKFYLTGQYNGRGGCKVGEAGCAPFGLTFEVPAKAGPFDLANTKNNHPACDCVVVRGKIELDPLTAAITITSNPPGTPDSIPTSIEGIPLEIQHVNATTTRGQFQFNPTNCSKMALTGTLQLSEGGLSRISTPFQVTNCAALSFKPGFSVSTSGKTSRARGASLHVKLVYPKAPFGSQANVRSVKVDLPKQLPSRLTTLQKACVDSVFAANPAACPAASRVGTAKAITPILPVPLEGPAYFVSHGGAKFPELIVVLQGYGVTLDLHGETFISKAGITSSTFHTIPDAPVGTFELTLPEGANSALAANGNLCSATRTVLVKKRVRVRSKGRTRLVTRKVRKTVSAGLVMPTAFNAQNGAVIHENTPIEVTGCVKHTLKGASKAKLKHKHKHNKKKKGKKKK